MAKRPVPPPRSVPVTVEYAGVGRHRVRRWFPDGIETAIEFFEELANEGKRPLIICSNDHPAPKPIKNAQRLLFQNDPDGLPD